MPINVQCSGCGGKFRAPDKAAGKRAKCPKCSAMIEVQSVQQQPAQLLVGGKKPAQSLPASKYLPHTPTACSSAFAHTPQPVGTKTTWPVADLREAANLQPKSLRQQCNIWIVVGLLLIPSTFLLPILIAVVSGYQGGVLGILAILLLVTAILFLIVGTYHASKITQSRFECELLRLRNVGMKAPDAGQVAKIESLAKQHLLREKNPPVYWYVAPEIPQHSLDKACRAYGTGMEPQEMPLALGCFWTGLLITDRAFYYNHGGSQDVQGVFALSNLGAVLGITGLPSYNIFFQLRDGRGGYFSCAGFGAIQKGIATFLSGVPFVFDSVESTQLLIPIERLLPGTASPCQVPARCAGCCKEGPCQPITVTWDATAVAEARSDRATLTGVLSGGIVGGIIGAIVGGIVAANAKRLELRLLCCNECTKSSVARIHGISGDKALVVLSNPLFGAAMARMNSFPEVHADA